MADRVFSREYVIKPSESNPKRELPLTLLVAQMIDLATDHANELGIGFIKLEPRGLGWVLSRLAVEIQKWPSTGESYILSTWVETWNRHYSERCFSIKDNAGNILGYARTIWMVIDLKEHNSAGTANMELPEEYIRPVECPMSRISKHKVFEPNKSTEYTFQYTDLDFYGHVNTVKYIALLLNQFTLEQMERNLLSRFEIAFMHEARYGETAIITSRDEFTADEFPDKPVKLQRNFNLHVADRPVLSSTFILLPQI